MPDEKPCSSKARAKALRAIVQWMQSVDRRPFPFQRKVWKAILNGDSGILHSPTGTGKTLAVWMGWVAKWMQQSGTFGPQDRESKAKLPKRKQRAKMEPIRVLWLTPLRALAADTRLALVEPVEDLKLPWSIELRTSDTASSLKAKQRERLPTCLITTPESLSLLISYPETHRQLSSVQMVVLDEWHELLSSKRGVQAELGLARLRRLNPGLQTWCLSATIGNVEEALAAALGSKESNLQRGHQSCIVRAPARRKTTIRSLIPEHVDRFPWAGHMGLKSLPAVVEAIESANSSLVFTNTRSQAEKWYSAILHAKPQWAGEIGVHHGSLDRKKRTWVENQLDAGKLKAVVCTSSLDLGVDFFPVDQVLQVGSPKGIARLLQRAGRSGHFPGGKSQVVFAPTHALELVEIAAARKAIQEKSIESRIPLADCLDVLAQHVITVACGEGFEAEELKAEARTTRAFAKLEDEQWNWVLKFAASGGESLKAYPDFQRLICEEGHYRIADTKVAKTHRMGIGTIASDPEVQVQFLKGGKLGTIEERFISKLKPGENFTFAGRTLKLVIMRDMTAWVRRARGAVTALPRWHGGRLPLSTQLAEGVRQQLGMARRDTLQGPEMKAMRPLLQLQARWSAIPDEHSLLIEKVKTRDGFHTFIFPFEGRLAHEGLAAILAWRLSRQSPITFASTVNDYGIELLSPVEPDIEKALDEGLLSTNNLLEQLEKSMNAAELDKRQFRDIAQVAGLIRPGFPGQGKSIKQIQASSSMFFDVFTQYDPDNLLLRQARAEVLSQQLEFERIAEAMNRMQRSQVLLCYPPKPTPLAFPILVDRLRMKMSSEKLSTRIERLTSQLEAAATRSESS
ncbi:MAG: ligase-associated DNA damage response DEXH box helicase [Planctomycetota bacterium]